MTILWFHPVEDKQWQLAWLTVKKVSRRKSIYRTKIKDVSQEKTLKKWKEHFKYLLGNPSEITDKPIDEIINGQLDIKLGHFMEKKLDAVLKTIQSRKAAVLDEIPPEVLNTRKFDNILLQLCNAVNRQNKIEK